MKLMTLETDPSYGGGSEAMALAISRELAARGHDVFLLHECNGTMLPAYREFVAGSFQLKLPGFALRAPVSTIRCAMRIGALARKQGIDAVLSSHLGYLRIAALVRVLYGVPFCFHLGLPAAGLPRSIRLAFRWIGAGVAPSHHTLKSWHREGWPLERLVTVPNWVDTKRFSPTVDRPLLRRELGIPRDSRCIAFVGRICPEKGIETLIRAFRQVRSRFEKATLVVVGKLESGYEPRFNQLIGQLDENVRQAMIVRPVSSTPEKYFASADVVCVPSCWDEPFGLTLLEAMACALPVVSTTVGMFAEIIGDHHQDLLVSPGDHVALAERLAWWLAQPDASKERGLELRQRVTQYFGPDKCMDTYESILRSMVKDAPKTSALLAYPSNCERA